MKILNFGSLNIDLYYWVQRFAAPGETVAGQDFARNIGGKGLNQSVALSRGGATVYHGGNVGPDGQMLVDYLSNSGVDVTHVQVVETPTGNAVIQIDPNGQNGILLYGGANRQVTEEQVATTLSHFGKGDWLVLQNEVNLVDLLITKAHEKGMVVALNPSPFAGCEALPLELVDWFMVNEHEAAQLAKTHEEEAIVTALRKAYPNAKFVMTLGSRGAVYFDRDTQYFQPPHPAKVVDTTGAGDTFTGFFFAALTRGESVEAAMELASRGAAVTISRVGAAPAIPTLAEIRQ